MARKNTKTAADTVVADAEIVSADTIEAVADAIDTASDKVMPPLADFEISQDCEKITLRTSDFVQERTRKTQSNPWCFYVKRKTVNALRHSVHQLGSAFGYAESDSVWMPSRSLFEANGNPYPNRINTAGNETSPAYRNHLPLVLVQHAIFNRLRQGAIVSAKDIFHTWHDIFDEAEIEAAKQLNVKSIKFPLNQFEKNWFAYGILHTLRDLECCNSLVLPQDAKRNAYTKWQINPMLSD